MAEVIIVAAKEAVRGITKKSNQVFIGGGGGGRLGNISRGLSPSRPLFMSSN